MRHDRYGIFAGYNLWANQRLYGAAAALTREQLRAPRGAFFGSVLGTLNHLLVTDRIWMGRFIGKPEVLALDTELFDSLAPLRDAREAEDQAIITFVDGLEPAALAAPFAYANMAGHRFSQPLDSALDHLFNHQTHHRGQVHALLTGFLGNEAVPSLDLIAYQRVVPGSPASAA